VARNALYGHRRALAPWRAAPSSIVFDDFIGLAFQRGIGATQPAGGVCRSVERTCDGYAKLSRMRRDGRGGARAPSPPSIAPFYLGLGIGVRKGWEVVLKYEIGGGEVGGRTRVRNWGKDVGYQNVTLWVPNIRTITSSLKKVSAGSYLF